MNKDTGTRRDLLAPDRRVNRRASRWWPLHLTIGLLISLALIILTGMKKAIISLFKKKKSVKGKVILITGAGRGLGRSISLKLARLGATIACADIHTKNNEETVSLIKSEGGAAEAFTCNIANSQHVEQLKKNVLDKFGNLDILINNAALIMPLTVKDITYDDIRATYEVNNMGPAFLTAAFLPGMIERNSGHIVTISSIAATSSIPYLSLYCSTKSGVSRFFEAVRVELDAIVGNNIKVTTIHPYFINTSADYTSWFQTFLPILKENYVANCSIDAVLYEKDSVTVPSPLNLIYVSDALAGSYQYNAVMKYFGDGIQLPSKSVRQQLPYTSIVSEISKTS